MIAGMCLQTKHKRLSHRHLQSSTHREHPSAGCASTSSSLTIDQLLIHSSARTDTTGLKKPW
jgi:hypothetical protein